MFFSLFAQLAYSQTSMQELKQADSLFESKRYTQSLQIYEKVLQKTGEASPRMLLRMAFIKEGLGDYTKTLYYLNLYYLRVPKQRVILKMEELAAKHNLRGYDFGDFDFFMVLYDRYYTYLIAGLLVIVFLLFLSMVWKKVANKEIPIRHGVGLILFMLSVLIVFNIRHRTGKAIVNRDRVYLMNAPSAGAKLVRVVRKGHRLNVYGKQDIWLETKWNNQPAYVRQQNVLLIQ